MFLLSDISATLLKGSIRGRWTSDLASCHSYNFILSAIVCFGGLVSLFENSKRIGTAAIVQRPVYGLQEGQ